MAGNGLKHRCGSCGKSLGGYTSKYRKLCAFCDQDIYVEDADMQHVWKRCLRGHDILTTKNWCPNENDPIMDRDTCGQELKPI